MSLGDIFNEHQKQTSANIVLCNDSNGLHRHGKSIAEKLHAQGHDITIACVSDQADLFMHLDKIREKGEAPPNAFFLDVGGVGETAALKVIKWFDKNYPGLPLPEIHFLSLDTSTGISEAGRLRESDSRVPASFVDSDELDWLSGYLAGADNPHHDPPVSTTFRSFLNAKLGTDLPLYHDDSGYADEIKKMREVTNDRALDAWQRGKLSAGQVIERMRNYSFGVADALRSGFYAGGGAADTGLKQDAQFYGSAGFPVKGPVVFSLGEVKERRGKEKPVLVMQGYDPDVVPLLASGKLGGLVVTSTYMASHLKLLCETHLVSGLFGLIPPGEKTPSREFNEVTRPIFPAYFEGDTVEIAGQKVKKGQAVLVGLGGNGMVFNPPDSPQTKPLDLSNIKEDDKLRADLKNLQKINACFKIFFAEKNLTVPGVKANIESADYRILNSVNGIGLVRTEQMVAAQTAQMENLKSILLRNDQGAYGKLFSDIKWNYNTVFSKLNQGQPVKIRLFDFVHQEILNRDEQKRFLELHPKLDVHGGEALAAWPRLYREQVRTIFSALQYARISSNTPLEIMMPAVRTEKDVLEIKNIVDEEAKKAGVEPGKYSFGVMIETLESCGNIAEIAKHCDFISFGTNDLTQQLFNMSRSDLKAHAHFAEKHGFDPFKKLAPEILELVKTVSVKGCEANAGLKIDVCGAQAADPDTAAALCHAGVDNVSVAPSLGNLHALPVLMNYKIYDSLQEKNQPACNASVTPE